MLTTSITASWARFTGMLRRHEGVAAIEFALVVPILLTLYLGAVEFSHGITANRKITNLSNTMADLVAQADSVDQNDMDNIFDAATAILTPYSTTTLEVVVSAVWIDGNGTATVEWSKAFQATPRSAGSTISLPASLVQPDTGLVVSEVQYEFTALVGKFLTNGVTLDDKAYLRPRQSDRVVWVN